MSNLAAECLDWIKINCCIYNPPSAESDSNEIQKFCKLCTVCNEQLTSPAHCECK